MNTNTNTLENLSTQISSSTVAEIEREFATAVVTACRQEDTTLDLACIVDSKSIDTDSLTSNLVQTNGVHQTSKVALKQTLFAAKDSIVLNTVEEVMENPEAYASQSQHFDALNIAFESTNAIGTFKNDQFAVQVGEVDSADAANMNSGVSGLVGLALFAIVSVAIIISIIKLIQSNSRKKAVKAKLDQVKSESVRLESDLKETIAVNEQSLESVKQTRVMKVVHNEFMAFANAFKNRTVLTADEADIFNAENPLNDPIKKALLEDHPNFAAIQAFIAEIEVMAISAKAKVIVNETTVTEEPTVEGTTEPKKEQSAE